VRARQVSGTFAGVVCTRIWRCLNTRRRISRNPGCTREIRQKVKIMQSLGNITNVRLDAPVRWTALPKGSPTIAIQPPAGRQRRRARSGRDGKGVILGRYPRTALAGFRSGRLGQDVACALPLSVGAAMGRMSIGGRGSFMVESHGAKGGVWDGARAIGARKRRMTRGGRERARGASTGDVCPQCTSRITTEHTERCGTYFPYQTESALREGLSISEKVPILPLVPWLSDAWVTTIALAPVPNVNLCPHIRFRCLCAS
jgi:hypothetical protein